MRKLVLGSIWVALAVVLPAACTTSPSSPTVSFASPIASGPSSGASFKFKAQPVTLTITNATRTGPATTTYSVEVATDAAFTNKVFTNASIPEGGGGTTTVTLTSLPGNTTYYWRSKSVVDGVTSQPSATQTFFVQQQIIITAPSPSAPTSGSTSSELRPTFVTQNATRQGAAGTIYYTFQVSTSPTFTTITAGATVQEQFGGQTSWTPSSDLPNTTLFWRVQASDPSNTEASSFSGAVSFVVQPFDPTKAIFYNNPSDVGSWPQTAKITSVDFSGDSFVVDFDKRQSSDRWPQSGLGDDGAIQYTLGLCLNLNNQWYCSAVIQYWDGRDPGATADIEGNWYYDRARWGPLAGHQPADGELVAVWVGQGNLRGSGNTYRERSNFVIMPFGGQYRAQ